ncbi:MAG: patatin-like phospholipase family protein, partial [Parvularculaceae bacterium]|nr:patatin-like phospholipase family protein [Parvularculaceae bacterium]
QGSLVEAARASSAIPVFFHAVRREGRWLVDGALANPAPVSLARTLGADVVISVDLNAVPRVLDRFSPPPLAAPVPPPQTDPIAPAAPVKPSIAKLIDETRKRVDEQIEAARARARESPQLFETAYAAADIFQMHLARARAIAAPADIYLAPDMRDALPTAFDRADEFIAEGRRALLEKRAEIESLLR